MVFKKMKIRPRLMVGFGVVLSLFVVCGVITTLLLMKSDRSVKVVREESMPFALTAKDIAFHVVQVQQFLTDVSATHDTGVLKEAEDSAVKFRQDAAKFREMYRVKNDQESLRKLEELESSFNNYYETGKTMANAYVTQGIEAGNILMEDFNKTSIAITAKVEEFVKQQTDEASLLSDNVKKSISQIITVLLVMTLITIV